MALIEVPNQKGEYAVFAYDDNQRGVILSSLTKEDIEKCDYNFESPCPLVISFYDERDESAEERCGQATVLIYLLWWEMYDRKVVNYDDLVEFMKRLAVKMKELSESGVKENFYAN